MTKNDPFFDRVVREGKQRRRKWAEKLTPRPSRRDGSAKKKIKTEGMLPDDIVQHVAAIEKAVNKKYATALSLCFLFAPGSRPCCCACFCNTSY